jgi:hypothetical protein
VTVTIDQMKDKLLTPDEFREELSKTEPLTSLRFAPGSLETHVSYGTDVGDDGAERRWHSREWTDAAPAWLHSRELGTVQLTYQAAQQLGSECRVPRQLQESWPDALLAEVVNWTLANGLDNTKDLKVLQAGLGKDPDGNECPLAVASCRGTLTPFSNLRLFDAMINAAQKRYGSDTEMYVDYKRTNDLDHTTGRLIVPARSIDITGTRVDDDTWSVGIQFDNSVIGTKQTQVKGYMFRWWCTNGQIDTAHMSPGFKRRNQTEDDVVAWVTEQVDEIFSGMEEHSFGAIQETAHQEVGDLVVPTLRDLFERASLPSREQKRVLENMAETDGTLTMYDLVNATTRVANQQGLTWRQQEQLMTMGGAMIHSGARCTQEHPCHRYLPAGWTVEDITPGSEEATNLAELS